MGDKLGEVASSWELLDCECASIFIIINDVNIKGGHYWASLKRLKPASSPPITHQLSLFLSLNCIQWSQVSANQL